MPQPLILEQLRELGIDISAGVVNRLLMEHKESFHVERAVSAASGCARQLSMCIRMTLALATRGGVLRGEATRPANLLAEWVLHRDWQ